ncbi:MAG TPA: hypothetical protein VM934_16660 [Pyrinomonadaceae bacterium]|jgi:hypothetical protein|nr:hypothetical protein [Pyrinomonadaceae bacterium]
MRLIYATGQPRFLEFATATSERQVPSGATVMAVADGERATNLFGEQTFSQMSDEEYAELQEMIRDVRQKERARI